MIKKISYITKFNEVHFKSNLGSKNKKCKNYQHAVEECEFFVQKFVPLKTVLFGIFYVDKKELMRQPIHRTFSRTRIPKYWFFSETSQNTLPLFEATIYVIL